MLAAVGMASVKWLLSPPLWSKIKVFLVLYIFYLYEHMSRAPMVVSADTSSTLSSVGAEESAAGGPEGSREPAGSPQSPGWKPSVPAGRAPNAHRQPQGRSEWHRHADGHHPSEQARSDPRLTHGASFSLKRPPPWQPKDSVPLGVPPATTGTTGAGTR